MIYYYSQATSGPRQSATRCSGGFRDRRARGRSHLRGPFLKVSEISLQFFLRRGAPSGLPKARGLPPGPSLKPSLTRRIGINGIDLLVSALLTNCSILLHTCWGILFYDGLEKRCWIRLSSVLLSHMLVSLLVSSAPHSSFVRNKHIRNTRLKSGIN